MTHRRKVLLGILFIGLVLAAGTGWWLYARSQSPSLKIVMRGASSSSNNLSVSGGNLVVVAPKPGVFFGTVQAPGRQEQFTYLILFRYGRPASNGSNRGIEVHCTSDGRKAETRDAIELDGKRIEVAYHIELDEKQTAIEKERLTIGGRSMDMTADQVFLIDLATETPTYQQKKVELPAIPSKLESMQDVEQLAETIRSSLENQDT
jgi:hypothetical protein